MPRPRHLNQRLKMIGGRLPFTVTSAWIVAGRPRSRSRIAFAASNWILSSAQALRRHIAARGVLLPLKSNLTLTSLGCFQSTETLQRVDFDSCNASNRKGCLASRTTKGPTGYVSTST